MQATLVLWVFMALPFAASICPLGSEKTVDPAAELPRGGFFAGRARAIWGKAPYVSDEDDHALIARIVNRGHPGHGMFLAMDGIDHGFNRADSRRTSFHLGRSRQPGEFNPAILEVAPAWAGKTDDETVPSALERTPEGWTDLLARPAPSSRAGRAGHCRRRQSSVPFRNGLWMRTTGYLVCQGDGGHEWLRWDQELGDFIYHVEWRFTPVPGKKGYNSGVYARNSADARIYHQAQTGDGSGGYLFGTTESEWDTQAVQPVQAAVRTRT